MNTIEQDFIDCINRICKVKREDFLKLNNIGTMLLDMLNKLYQEDCPPQFKNDMKELLFRMDSVLDAKDGV